MPGTHAVGQAHTSVCRTERTAGLGSGRLEGRAAGWCGEAEAVGSDRGSHAAGVRPGCECWRGVRHHPESDWRGRRTVEGKAKKGVWVSGNVSHFCSEAVETNTCKQFGPISCLPNTKHLQDY